MERHIKSKREELLLELHGWMLLMIKPECIEAYFARFKKASNEDILGEIHKISLRAHLISTLDPRLSIGIVAQN